MTQPLISIIIPTFNRADLIGETLDSIIAQTYQNWECIVVDDGSTDNTAEVLKKYTDKDDRIKYHHRPAPYKAGGNGARNYGFDISKGDYVNWFDSDDTMASDFLMEKITNISNNDFIICSHFTTNENLEISQIHNIANTDNILLDFITWGPNFNVLTPSILFRRLFLSNGGFRFNEKILRGQEAVFLLNIFATRNFTYIIIDIPLFFYRQHSQTKTELNKNKSAIFNFSLLYVNFYKFEISKKNNFNEVLKNSKIRLKIISEKTVKDRDLTSILFIVKVLFRLFTISSITLGTGILIFYFFNKTPKFIYKYWDKI